MTLRMLACSLLLVSLIGCGPTKPPCPTGFTPVYKTALMPMMIGKTTVMMPRKVFSKCVPAEKLEETK